VERDILANGYVGERGLGGMTFLGEQGREGLLDREKNGDRSDLEADEMPRQRNVRSEDTLTAKRDRCYGYGGDDLLSIVGEGVTREERCALQ